MRRGILLAVIFGAALFLPAAASAQPVPCNDADLVGTWLYSFEKVDEPIVCAIKIDDTLDVDAASCNVKTLSETLTEVTGNFDITDSCHLIGTVKMKGIGTFQLQARISTDRSVIMGVFYNEKNLRFYPLNMIRWLD